MADEIRIPARIELDAKAAQGSIDAMKEGVKEIKVDKKFADGLNAGTDALKQQRKELDAQKFLLERTRKLRQSEKDYESRNAGLQLDKLKKSDPDIMGVFNTKYFVPGEIEKQFDEAIAMIEAKISQIDTALAGSGSQVQLPKIDTSSLVKEAKTYSKVLDTFMKNEMYSSSPEGMFGSETAFDELSLMVHQFENMDFSSAEQAVEEFNKIRTRFSEMINAGFGDLDRRGALTDDLERNLNVSIDAASGKVKEIIKQSKSIEDFKKNISGLSNVEKKIGLTSIPTTKKFADADWETVQAEMLKGMEKTVSGCTEQLKAVDVSRQGISETREIFNKIISGMISGVDISQQGEEVILSIKEDLAKIFQSVDLFEGIRDSSKRLEMREPIIDSSALKKEIESYKKLLSEIPGEVPDGITGMMDAFDSTTFKNADKMIEAFNEIRHAIAGLEAVSGNETLSNLFSQDFTKKDNAKWVQTTYKAAVDEAQKIPEGFKIQTEPQVIETSFVEPAVEKMEPIEVKITPVIDPDVKLEAQAKITPETAEEKYIKDGKVIVPPRVDSKELLPGAEKFLNIDAIENLKKSLGLLASVTPRQDDKRYDDLSYEMARGLPSINPGGFERYTEPEVKNGYANQYLAIENMVNELMAERQTALNTRNNKSDERATLIRATPVTEDDVTAYTEFMRGKLPESLRGNDDFVRYFAKQQIDEMTPERAHTPKRSDVNGFDNAGKTYIRPWQEFLHDKFNFEPELEARGPLSKFESSLVNYAVNLRNLVDAQPKTEIEKTAEVKFRDYPEEERKKYEENGWSNWVKGGSLRPNGGSEINIKEMYWHYLQKYIEDAIKGEVDSGPMDFDTWKKTPSVLFRGLNRGESSSTGKERAKSTSYSMSPGVASSFAYGHNGALSVSMMTPEETYGSWHDTDDPYYYRRWQGRESGSWDEVRNHEREVIVPKDKVAEKSSAGLGAVIDISAIGQKEVNKALSEFGRGMLEAAKNLPTDQLPQVFQQKLAEMYAKFDAIKEERGLKTPEITSLKEIGINENVSAGILADAKNGFGGSQERRVRSRVEGFLKNKNPDMDADLVEQIEDALRSSGSFGAGDILRKNGDEKSQEVLSSAIQSHLSKNFPDASQEDIAAYTEKYLKGYKANPETIPMEYDDAKKVFQIASQQLYDADVIEQKPAFRSKASKTPDGLDAMRKDLIAQAYNANPDMSTGISFGTKIFKKSNISGILDLLNQLRIIGSAGENAPVSLDGIDLTNVFARMQQIADFVKIVGAASVGTSPLLTENVDRRAKQLQKPGAKSFSELKAQKWAMREAEEGMRGESLYYELSRKAIDHGTEDQTHGIKYSKMIRSVGTHFIRNDLSYEDMQRVLDIAMEAIRQGAIEEKDPFDDSMFRKPAEEIEKVPEVDTGTVSLSFKKLAERLKGIVDASDTMARSLDEYFAGDVPKELLEPSGWERFIKGGESFEEAYPSDKAQAKYDDQSKRLDDIYDKFYSGKKKGKSIDELVNNNPDILQRIAHSRGLDPATLESNLRSDFERKPKEHPLKDIVFGSQRDKKMSVGIGLGSIKRYINKKREELPPEPVVEEPPVVEEQPQPKKKIDTSAQEATIRKWGDAWKAGDMAGNYDNETKTFTPKETITEDEWKQLQANTAVSGNLPDAMPTENIAQFWQNLFTQASQTFKDTGAQIRAKDFFTGDPNEIEKKGKYTIMTGLPGAGKSSFTNTLPEGTNIVDMDQIKKKAFGAETAGPAFDFGLLNTLRAIQKYQVQSSLMNGEDVVLDGVNQTTKGRAMVMKWGKDYASEVDSAVIPTPANIAVARQNMRQRKIQSEAIYKSAESWTTPTTEEGFDKVTEYPNHEPMQFPAPVDTAGLEAYMTSLQKSAEILAKYQGLFDQYKQTGERDVGAEIDPTVNASEFGGKELEAWQAYRNDPNIGIAMSQLMGQMPDPITGTAEQMAAFNDLIKQKIAEQQGIGVQADPARAVQTGNDVGSGYANGMREKIPEANAAGVELGESGLEGVATGAQSHSDSVFGLARGNDVGSGYAHGMQEKIDEAQAAGEELGQAGLEGLNSATSRGGRVGDNEALSKLLPKYFGVDLPEELYDLDAQGLEDVINNREYPTAQSQLDSMYQDSIDYRKENGNSRKALEGFFKQNPDTLETLANSKGLSPDGFLSETYFENIKMPNITALLRDLAKNQVSQALAEIRQAIEEAKKNVVPEIADEVEGYDDGYDDNVREMSTSKEFFEEGQKRVKDVKYVDSDKYLDTISRDGTMEDWTVNELDTSKEALVKTILSSQEYFSSTLSASYDNAASAAEGLSFEQFLGTPIAMFRGTGSLHGQRETPFESMSLDPYTAGNFAAHMRAKQPNVQMSMVKPGQTYGANPRMLEMGEELENFVPNEAINSNLTHTFTFIPAIKSMVNSVLNKFAVEMNELSKTKPDALESAFAKRTQEIQSQFDEASGIKKPMELGPREFAEKLQEYSSEALDYDPDNKKELRDMVDRVGNGAGAYDHADEAKGLLIDALTQGITEQDENIKGFEDYYSGVGVDIADIYEKTFGKSGPTGQEKSSFFNDALTKYFNGNIIGGINAREFEDYANSRSTQQHLSDVKSKVELMQLKGVEKNNYAPTEEEKVAFESEGAANPKFSFSTLYNNLIANVQKVISSITGNITKDAAVAGLDMASPQGIALKKWTTETSEAHKLDIASLARDPNVLQSLLASSYFNTFGGQEATPEAFRKFLETRTPMFRGNSQAHDARNTPFEAMANDARIAGGFATPKTVYGAAPLTGMSSLTASLVKPGQTYGSYIKDSGYGYEETENFVPNQAMDPDFTKRFDIPKAGFEASIQMIRNFGAELESMVGNMSDSELSEKFKTGADELQNKIYANAAKLGYDSEGKKTNAYDIANGTRSILGQDVAIDDIQDIKAVDQLEQVKQKIEEVNEAKSKLGDMGLNDLDFSDKEGFLSKLESGNFSDEQKENAIGLFDSVGEKTNNALALMQQNGQYMGEGVVEGLGQADVTAGSSELVSSIDQAIRAAAGIASPAEEFKYIGYWMAMGILEGFKDANFTQYLSELVRQSIEAATNNKNININRINRSLDTQSGTRRSAPSGSSGLGGAQNVRNLTINGAKVTVNGSPVNVKGNSGNGGRNNSGGGANTPRSGGNNGNGGLGGPGGNKWGTPGFLVMSKAFRMAGSAIRSMKRDVEELDKSITAIATVSNLSSDELWGKASQYSNIAKQYGTSLNEVYKTSLLYYQQGMPTNEVDTMVKETLKLSKISGTDVTKAADYMTNAFRSFKMEVSDAHTVTDVFANLSANAAVSVTELSEAMSKAATSMEATGASFENTSAFIAMMTETTRESASTMGSALQSIAARYSQIKTDPKGVTEDNQTVVLNDVDKALTSIGIDMQDEFGQIRDMDDVILELSSKWQTLDRNTQSYVATLMAGSRQKARFLALVGNYQRLTELTEEAANSENAAQAQLIKNMDSIETKQQNLKNSIQSLYVDWDLESSYKGMLDFLTNGINRLSTATFPQTTSNILVGSVVGGIVGKIKSAIATSVGDKNGVLNLKQLLFGGANADGTATEGLIKQWGSKLVGALGQFKLPEGKVGSFLNKVLGVNSGAFQAVGAGLGAALSIGMKIATKDMEDGTGKGLLTLLGGLGSVASVGLSVGSVAGPIAGVAAAAVTAVVEGFKVVDAFFESASEEQERLQKTFEEKNNTAITLKQEEKGIDSAIKKLERLKKARYDSNEANQEYLNYCNEVASKYEGLVTAYDAEGNAIVGNLVPAYEKLADAAGKASKAQEEAAEANLEVMENRLKNFENFKEKLYATNSGIQQGTNGTNIYASMVGGNGYTAKQVMTYLLSKKEDGYDIAAEIDAENKSGDLTEYFQKYAREIVDAFKAIGDEDAAKELEELINSEDFSVLKFFNYVRQYGQQEEYIRGNLKDAQISSARSKVEREVVALRGESPYETNYRLYNPIYNNSGAMDAIAAQAYKEFEGELANNPDLKFTDWFKDNYIDFDNPSSGTDKLEKKIESYGTQYSQLNSKQRTAFDNVSSEFTSFASDADLEKYLQEIGISDENIRKDFMESWRQQLETSNEYYSAAVDDYEDKYGTKIFGEQNILDDTDNQGQNFKNIAIDYKDAILSDLSDVDDLFLSGLEDRAVAYGNAVTSLWTSINNMDDRKARNALSQWASTADFSTTKGIYQAEQSLSDLVVTGKLTQEQADNVAESIGLFKNAVYENANTFLSGVAESYKTAADAIETLTGGSSGLSFDKALEGYQKIVSKKGNASLRFDQLYQMDGEGKWRTTAEGLILASQQAMDEVESTVNATYENLRTQLNGDNEILNKLTEDNYDDFQSAITSNTNEDGTINWDSVYSAMNFDNLSKEAKNELQEGSKFNTFAEYNDWLNAKIEYLTKNATDEAELAMLKSMQDATNRSREISYYKSLDFSKITGDMSGADKSMQENLMMAYIQSRLGIEDKDELDAELEKAMRLIGNGGQSGAEYAKELFGDDLTDEAMQTIFSARLTKFTTAFESITKGAGTILDEQTAKFLEDEGILEDIARETSFGYVTKNLSTADIAKAAMAFKDNIKGLLSLGQITISEANEKLVSIIEMQSKVTKDAADFTKNASDGKIELSDISTLATSLNMTVDNFISQYMGGIEANYDGSYSVNLAQFNSLVDSINGENEKLIDKTASWYKDIVNEIISNLSTLVKNGMSGSLKFEDADTLKSNFGLTDLDFTRGADGLKLTESAVANIYSQMKEIDVISAKATLKNIVSDAKNLGDGLETASKVYDRIEQVANRNKALTEQITELQRKQASEGLSKEEEARLEILQKQTAELRTQTELYKDMAAQDLYDPNAYKLSDQNVTDGTQAGLNLWESAGDFMTTATNLAKQGHMSVKDFTNYVNFINENVGEGAALFQKTGMTAAELINCAVANIDNSGKNMGEINLASMGLKFAGNAEAFKGDVATGVNSLAQSNIKMIDAAINMLEAIIAMKDIDVDDSGTFDFNELFTFDDNGNITGLNKNVIDWLTKLQGATGLIKIGNQTLTEFLTELAQTEGGAEKVQSLLTKLFSIDFTLGDTDIFAQIQAILAEYSGGAEITNLDNAFSMFKGAPEGLQNLEDFKKWAQEAGVSLKEAERLYNTLLSGKSFKMKNKGGEDKEGYKNIKKLIESQYGKEAREAIGDAIDKFVGEDGTLDTTEMALLGQVEFEVDEKGNLTGGIYTASDGSTHVLSATPENWKQEINKIEEEITIGKITGGTDGSEGSKDKIATVRTSYNTTVQGVIRSEGEKYEAYYKGKKIGEFNTAIAARAAIKKAAEDEAANNAGVGTKVGNDGNVKNIGKRKQGTSKEDLQNQWETSKLSKITSREKLKEAIKDKIEPGEDGKLTVPGFDIEFEEGMTEDDIVDAFIQTFVGDDFDSSGKISEAITNAFSGESLTSIATAFGTAITEAIKSAGGIPISLADLTIDESTGETPTVTISNLKINPTNATLAEDATITITDATGNVTKFTFGAGTGWTAPAEGITLPDGTVAMDQVTLDAGTWLPKVGDGNSIELTNNSLTGKLQHLKIVAEEVEAEDGNTEVHYIATWVDENNNPITELQALDLGDADKTIEYIAKWGQMNGGFMVGSDGNLKAPNATVDVVIQDETQETLQQIAENIAQIATTHTATIKVSYSPLGDGGPNLNGIETDQGKEDQVRTWLSSASSNGEALRLLGEYQGLFNSGMSVSESDIEFLRIMSSVAGDSGLDVAPWTELFSGFSMVNEGVSTEVAATVTALKGLDLSSEAEQIETMFKKLSQIKDITFDNFTSLLQTISDIVAKAQLLGLINPSSANSDTNGQNPQGQDATIDEATVEEGNFDSGVEVSFPSVNADSMNVNTSSVNMTVFGGAGGNNGGDNDGGNGSGAPQNNTNGQIGTTGTLDLSNVDFGAVGTSLTQAGVEGGSALAESLKTILGGIKIDIKKPDPVNISVNKPKVSATATLTVKVRGGGGTNVGGDVSSTISSGGSAKGNVALAKGSAMAGGSSNTLMGELGPELVVSDGHYYTVGNQGAEFVDLPNDAIVFNHMQTKKLLTNGHASRGKPVKSEKAAISFAKGNVSGPAKASAESALAELQKLRAMWAKLASASAKDLAGAGSGGGGGGGGGGDNSPFVADLNRWYNLEKQIERLEKSIALLEKERANYIKSINEDGYKYANSVQQSLTYLQSEIDKQKELNSIVDDYYNKRVATLEAEDNPYSRLLTLDTETGAIQYIDDGFRILAELQSKKDDGVTAALTDQQQLDKIKSFFTKAYNGDTAKVNAAMAALKTKADGTEAKEKKDQVQVFWDNIDAWREELESYQAKLDETNEAIEDLEKSVSDLKQEIVDNTIEVEKALMTAYTDKIQDEIDALQDHADAIKDASDAYIEGLNKALEKEKAMYENQKSDAELAKKQRQLAILERTGGSASEIASLRSEINNSLQEEYFNKQQEQIDLIQNAVDKQTEALEKQIDIQTKALEYSKEHGLYWEQIYKMMADRSESYLTDYISGYTKEYGELSGTELGEKLNEISMKIQKYLGSTDAAQAALADFTSGLEGKGYSSSAITAASEAFLTQYGKSERGGSSATSASSSAKAKAEEVLKDTKAGEDALSKFNELSYMFMGLEGINKTFGTNYSTKEDAIAAIKSKLLEKSDATDSEIMSAFAGNKRKSEDVEKIKNYAATLGWDSEPTQAINAGGLRSNKDGTGSNTNPKGQYRPIEWDGKNEKNTGKAFIKWSDGNGHEGWAQGYGKHANIVGAFKALEGLGIKSYEQYKKFKLAGYKNGGVVDYTGIAQLHGTKSKPEAVLSNADYELLKSKLFSDSNYSLKSTVDSITSLMDSMSNATNGITTNDNGITFENVNLTIESGVINNDYDAKKAGQNIMEEMMKIARKSGNISITRR